MRVGLAPFGKWTAEGAVKGVFAEYLQRQARVRGRGYVGILKAHGCVRESRWHRG